MKPRGHELLAALVAERIVGSDDEDDAEPVADARRLEAALALYADGAPAPAPPRTIPLRRRVAVWTAVAVAAAGLLAVTLRSAGLHAPPLGTRYELTLARATAVLRGHDEGDGVPTYRADRTIEVWLRPMDPVDGPLEVAVYARRDDAARRLAVDPQIAGNGVVHIVAALEAIGLTPGEWDLAFVVGRPEAVPDDLTPTPQHVPDDPLPYQVHTARIRIVEREASSEPR